MHLSGMGGTDLCGIGGYFLVLPISYPISPLHRLTVFCKIIHTVVYITNCDLFGKDDGLFKKDGGV